MDRAYSILHVKGVEEDQRIIRGVATTPETDRIGDVVEPLGISFKNPLPLLHHHRHDEPVGNVRFDKPTKDGITFEAKLPKIAEPGPLKDRVDTAWGEIKAGLIRAVSIGFKAIEHAFLDTGGIHFISSEVVELSLVTVPANASATITQIRSIDAPLLAATGRAQESVRRENPAGASASTKPVTLKGTAMKTIAEQITALEAKRLTLAQKLEAIQSKALEEGRTKDAAEKEEFTNIREEIKAVDEELADLRDMEALSAKKAVAVPAAAIDSAEKGAAARGRAEIVVKTPEKLLPGIAATRIWKTKAISRLDGESPRDVAKQLYGENSGTFEFYAKAAVAAGNTGNTTWAANLISDEGGPFADFVEFLRPQTILGKFGSNGIPSLRRVPFRRALLGQTSGGAAYWVGEGKPKPLTKFDFSRTTLEPLKVANIAVITEEVLRDSSPSAEGLVRDGLAAAIVERLDIDFIDPDKSASAGVSPASISNGITALTSAGNDADSVREDIKAIVGAFTDADNRPSTGVWIMSSAMALSLSLMQNPLGQSEFPGLGMSGGSFFGMPVIVSDYVRDFADSNGEYIFMVNAADVYLADEGGIRIDMSREAALQMDDSPGTQDATTGTGTSLVSLWQTNSVGFLAERTISWARRRAEAVVVLGSVNWGVASA